MGFEGDGASYEEMEIRECDPPRTLTVTSHVGPYVWYLDVDLSEADGVTTLAFSQPDLDHDDSLSVGPGWEYYLDRLVAVETGGDLAAIDFERDYYPAMADYYREQRDASIGITGLDLHLRAWNVAGIRSGSGQGVEGVRRPGQQVAQVPLGERQDVGDRDLSTELGRQRGDAGVGDAARDEAVVPAQVDVAVEGEAVHGHAPADPDADGRDLALGQAAPVSGSARSHTPLRPGTRAVSTPRSRQTPIRASSRRRT